MSCADLAHSHVGENMLRAIFILAAAANISACAQPANESRTSTVQIFTPKKRTSPKLPVTGALICKNQFHQVQRTVSAPISL